MFRERGTDSRCEVEGEKEGGRQQDEGNVRQELRRDARVERRRLMVQRLWESDPASADHSVRLTAHVGQGSLGTNARVLNKTGGRLPHSGRAGMPTRGSYLNC